MNVMENGYVIPFCLGPIGGRYSINAVQLTDSAFVVLNMRVITRVSSAIWDAIGQADFVRCIHSVGRPRPITARLKSNWMCNTDQYFLAQRLAENDVWSYGSAFGENAFLSKTCVSLRLAMYRGWKGGWLALPAAIIAVKGAGKTELATMTPTLPGWQVRMLGDDVAWIRCGTDGKMHALAPENGLFGCTVRCTPENGDGFKECNSCKLRFN
ncbi:phosphoenolpyruvate carboxykinase [Ancylostoma ceylanicum]|uniref:phosphoenolpyruvate carboxykinase (GTP) n=1 Tax=Ancylostoma ceylanicum TaxID=53326 RepID=A0A0D6LJ80_9BILA|nr:phosphoenolpyruvate carboxykinase [Ancylostoma ceylanicum]